MPNWSLPAAVYLPGAALAYTAANLLPMATCRRRGFALGALLTLVSGPAQAGPPLVTDNPVTLDPGQWEFNVVVSGEDRDSVHSAEFPLLEAIYGASENFEFGFGATRQHINPDGESSKSGWGLGILGMKWRFFSRDNFELALNPTYIHTLSHSSRIRGIIEDVNVLGLPLIAGWTAGNWTWNAQVAYGITSVSTNAWDYGISVWHPAGDSVQLGFEIWGTADDDFDTGVLNYRFGLDWEFLQEIHLLAGLGGPLSSDLPKDEELNYDYVLSVQWFR